MVFQAVTSTIIGTVGWCPGARSVRTSDEKTPGAPFMAPRWTLDIAKYKAGLLSDCVSQEEEDKKRVQKRKR